MNLVVIIVSAIGNILEIQMYNIKPEELLDESKFTDFLKAATLGASMYLTPLANAEEPHELEIAELASDMINQYNVLQNTHTLTIAGAQQLADEAFTQVCGEVQTGDEAAENTEAWGSVKATYEYLVEKDYKIATAFVAKFNHAARQLFGVQIQALPDPKKV